MNYLAHLLLSGNDEDVIFGNFIGDAIKGQSWDEVLGTKYEVQSTKYEVRSTNTKY